MKKIVTMVGTSLFENFFKETSQDSLYNYYDELRDKRAKEWENQTGRIERVRKGVENWLKDKNNDISVSAEAKSLIKLKQKLNDNFQIYLLSSDTIISKLAGKIVKDVLKNWEIDVIDCKVVKGLQVLDREEFRKGMSNLISIVYEIAEGYWNNVIINITGGFKATIPFLTILAQLNGCKIYYIFEKTDALIDIPNIPFSKELIDFDELGNYLDLFIQLEKGITEENGYYKFKNSEFYKRYSFLIWEEESLAELNPIGKILFEKYKENYFVFFVTEDAKKEIGNSPELRNVLKRFSKRETRMSKTEAKNGHFVYDDGNNSYRIFYREKNENIYVYKAFCNHDKYKYYLNKVPYSDDIFTKENFTTEKFYIGG